VARSCNPASQIKGNTDHAQKTAFGISLTRMRDRVFRIGDYEVKLVKAGIEHQATHWQLVLNNKKAN
ncbi:MAG: hypothetical protein AAFW82_11360, partial [Pseudomonadota bacterium]